MVNTKIRLVIFFAGKDGEMLLYSHSQTVQHQAHSHEPQSDHELLRAKLKLKLKKVGETTRPFRYDQNQLPYDYILEVTNGFKTLDLIDRVSEELWKEVRCAMNTNMDENSLAFMELKGYKGDCDLASSL